MSVASRLYLTSRAHGAVYHGPLRGNWSAGHSTRDARGDGHWTFLMDPSNVGGGVITTLTWGGPVAGGSVIPAGNTHGSVRWAKKAVASGSLTGTLTLCLSVTNPSAAAFQEAYGQCYAYVADGATLALKAVLVDNIVNGTNWTSTGTYRTMAFAIGGTVAYDAGDLIVIEFGAACVPATTPPGDFLLQSRWGTTNSSLVAQADAVNGDTAARAAWVDFPSAVSWEDDALPNANDACVDAVVIATVPYVSPVVDTTQSADTNRRTWWVWTADRTARMILSTLGSNYYTQVRALTGVCGAQSTLVLGASTVWIGTGQAVTRFDAVLGTTYYFRIDSVTVTAGVNAALTAPQSGGAAVLSLYETQAPQTNDLYVDCQHVGVFRAGVPINWTELTYGLTPTGNAIDYTLRPLDDVNGGVNTSQRLYVGLFGADPTIAILDLPTLNFDEQPVDQIFDPLQGTDRGQNISTVVFNATGDLVMGWYGDHYAVVDELSSPNACAVRRMDATHADDQTGAPWPAPEAWVVAQENGGTDFVELLADQHTIVYTSGGQRVLAYDLLTQTQLPDIALLPAPTGPRPGARSVRALSPGDGSSGYLVAYGDKVLRLDSAGAVIQTYVPTLTSQAQDLDKIELSADGLSFWVSDQYSTYIFAFSLDGTEGVAFPTQMPSGQLCGFAVYNGFRAGNPPEGPPPPPPPPPPPVGGPGCPPDWSIGEPSDGACAPEWSV